MKLSLSLFLLLLVNAPVWSQSRKPARMAPLYSNGYYVTVKNDTMPVRIQTNAGDESEFFRNFYFVSEKVRKPKAMNAQKAKAYGFNGRNFIAMEVNGKKQFVERLVSGRLRFYEYRFIGKIDGNPGVESIYFVKDTYAEGEDIKLKEPRKVSLKFYKRFLKPYMKDQPMIWSDLNKYTFEREKVVSALIEFNGYYTRSGT